MNPTCSNCINNSPIYSVAHGIDEKCLCSCSISSALDKEKNPVLEHLISVKNSKFLLFLDYDGTLTPIVNDPNKAILTEEMRDLLNELSLKHIVCIITGRSINTIKQFVKLNNLLYAGSHGFDIRKPEFVVWKKVAEEYLPDLNECYEKLNKRLADIPNSLVENNIFSLSVHYRNVLNNTDRELIDSIVCEELLHYSSSLERRNGKMVYEIRPKIQWNKGEAIQFILNHINEIEPNNNSKELIPIVLGDDFTDEDGFKTLKDNSKAVSIFVTAGNHRKTHAKFSLNSVEEVQLFLKKLANS